MWDLNDGGKITGILRSPHENSGHGRISGVNKIEFLIGQPVMVSTGMDNALRSWIFDEIPFSPVPRPLHTRGGHSAPVTTLNFLPTSSIGSDAVGKWLLSGSKDHSLWGFSLRKDSQNFELSQGKIKSKVRKMGKSHGYDDQDERSEDLKAPEVTCIACSLTRDGGMGTATGGPAWANARGGSAESFNSTGWESIVTGHRGDKFARTWFWGKKKAGRWAFQTADGTEVKVRLIEAKLCAMLICGKSVAISSCGTFALVGSAGGSVDMFNLQSGIHRQTFPSRITSTQAKIFRPHQLDTLERIGGSRKKLQTSHGKHTKAVTGVMISNLNTTVISCSLDGKLKVRWVVLRGIVIGCLTISSSGISYPAS
jgi:U3 small nucleolar RNA-associated protein 21